MYIGLFPFWGREGAITSNAIMNGLVCVCVCAYISCMNIFVGEILRRVIAGSKCMCVLNFNRFVQIVSF